MTMAVLHNGGVGIGKSINGGFGLLLDGSKRVDEIIKSHFPLMLSAVLQEELGQKSNSLNTAIEHNKIQTIRFYFLIW